MPDYPKSNLPSLVGNIDNSNVSSGLFDKFSNQEDSGWSAKESKNNYGDSKYDQSLTKQYFEPDENGKTGMDYQRAAMQSNWSKAGNGILNMAGRAVTSGAEGILNPFVGTFYAIANGSLASYIDNPFTRLMDSADKQVKEALPFYSTKEADEAHGLSKLLYANTWYRDVLDGIGVTAVAMATGGVYSKMITALGKTAMMGKAGEFIDGLAKIGNKSDQIQYIKNLNTITKIK